MSVSSLIAPYPASVWRQIVQFPTKQIGNLRIDPEECKQKIIEQWAKAEIREPAPGDEPYFPLRWRLPPSREGFSGLWGNLQANLQVVSFGTGPKESFLEFILWYRKYIPPEYPLFLFDSSSVDSLEINLYTSEQEIIDFAGIVD